MIPGNIESEIKQIIKTKGKDGWLRMQECAKEFAKDPRTKKHNSSRRTEFYRLRKQIGKGRVEGLKVLLLPGNVSYIGLSSADPKFVEKLISEDKKVSRNVKTGFGFFEWRERIAQRKQLEHDKLIDRLRREDAAETEICELDEDDDLVKKTHEVNRKHGLL